MPIKSIRMMLGLTAIILLVFCKNPAYSEEIEELEELYEDTRVTKTLEGVVFQIEPDRKLGYDSVTGIIVPEAVDSYAARKINRLRDENNKALQEMSERVQSLEERLEKIESLAAPPTLITDKVEPEETTEP